MSYPHCRLQPARPSSKIRLLPSFNLIKYTKRQSTTLQIIKLSFQHQNYLISSQIIMSDLSKLYVVQWFGRLLKKRKETRWIYEILASAETSVRSFLSNLKGILSYWTFNICLILSLYFFVGQFYLPQLFEHDPQAIKGQQKLRYAIKGSLIYGLGLLIVFAIHEMHDNDYMNILKANNREGFKRIFLFNIRLAAFYCIAIRIPPNFYANRLLAFLTLYIWLSQEYVRKSIYNNFHTLTYKRMQFVNNFSMNQATSLVFVFAPLSANLFPQLLWLPGIVTLLPILWRFAQCFIVGTHEQYLNSIKFSLNLIGFGFAIVEMPLASHYGRILAAIYSFYWDVIRDWKWKIRFYEKKDYRIHLPVKYFVLGLLYDLIGRSIWIFVPMTVNVRGLIQITRRLTWDVLRIQRQQVFYYPRPQGNKVKDLFSA